MIPVCEPTLSSREKEYVLDCLETGWISSNGKYIEKFEAAFSMYCGAKYGVSCCNGTAALHLALAALDIGPGDEVILPSFSMIATGNAVVYTGATAVLVDTEPDTWNIDPDRVADAMTDKTRAIIVVHTYGHPVDMDRILTIAARRGIPVVEDAAEAHGAEYKGRRCGSLAALAAFSFYGNKILTTGEGGMVTTSDPALAAKLASLRNHCFGEPRFLHKHIGFNYRMTNIQAAIGLAQTEMADHLVDSRRNNALEYNRLLSGVKGITTPPEAEWAKSVYWMYGLLLEDDFPLDRDETMRRLKARGVDTRAFFYPMHKQPCYMDYRYANKPMARGPMHVSERIGARGIYLPSSSHLSRDQIETVVAAIRDLSETVQ